MSAEHGFRMRNHLQTLYDKIPNKSEVSDTTYQATRLKMTVPNNGLVGLNGFES